MCKGGKWGERMEMDVRANGMGGLLVAQVFGGQGCVRTRKAPCGKWEWGGRQAIPASSGRQAPPSLVKAAGRDECR